MKRYIFYILLLVPILVWAAATTIINPGSWDDPGIWLGGEIADNLGEDVVMTNNNGEVTILSPDSYEIADLVMNNQNTLTIDLGGSLTIGSNLQSNSLSGLNNNTINVNGPLEIWDFLDFSNDFTLNVTGTLIIHGDMTLNNDADIDIQGDVTIDGDLNGGDRTDINVDGTLIISGTVDIGVDSNLTGSGTVSLSGGCTGPASFCSGPQDDIPPPMVIEAFTGEPKEICLDVRDSDGDVLTVTAIDYGTLNGVIEGPGSVDNLCFIYTSFDDFEGEELVIFTVCDNGTPVRCIKVEVRIKVALDLRLTIYKAFTPDGDNINDVWEIKNIQNYPSNQVMVYDRLGGLIFSAKGYNNEDIVWDGRSNQNGQNILPSGTYFYKIDLGSEHAIQKGFIELVN